MYKYAKDVLEFKLQNKNVSENMIKMLLMAPTQRGVAKTPRENVHCLAHGKSRKACSGTGSCVWSASVGRPDSDVVLLVPRDTKTQFSLLKEKYGKFIMVQLVIIIYYPTT